MDFTYAIYFLIVAAGIGMILTGKNLWVARQSVRWPKASGQIVQSRVIERKSRSYTEYRSQVRYRYQVGGKTFESEKIEFVEEWFRNREIALQTANEYPVDAPVDVFHHPQKPNRAVLKTGAHQLQYALAGAFGLFFLAFIYWHWAEVGLIQWLLQRSK